MPVESELSAHQKEETALGETLMRLRPVALALKMEQHQQVAIAMNLHQSPFRDDASPSLLTLPAARDDAFARAMTPQSWLSCNYCEQGEEKSAGFWN